MPFFKRRLFCQTFSTLTKVVTVRVPFFERRWIPLVWKNLGWQHIILKAIGWSRGQTSHCFRCCRCTIKIRLIGNATTTSAFHLSHSGAFVHQSLTLWTHVWPSCPHLTTTIPQHLQCKYVPIPAMFYPYSITRFCGDAHTGRHNMIIMCKNVHSKLATVSGCLFLLQGSWNQGGRGVGDQIHQRTQHPRDWWWHHIADCTHQPITATSPTPTQSTTPQFQHPEAWHYVLVPTFWQMWRGDAWRSTATASISNPASPTTWRIAVLARDKLHLDGTM